jgi:hypothetical protein
MMPSLFLSSPFLHKSYFAPCPMSDVRYPVSDAIEYQSILLASSSSAPSLQIKERRRRNLGSKPKK